MLSRGACGRMVLGQKFAANGANLYGPFMSPPANASRSLTQSRAFDADQLNAARCRRQWRDRDGTHSWMMAMLDFLMIAYGVGFFAASVLYVLACEKM